VATYDYQCDKCNTVCEVIHTMFDESPQLCSSCDQKMHKVYLSSSYGFISEPKTFGGIADKNSDKYSNDQKMEMNIEHKRERGKKKKREPQWYDQYRTRTHKEVAQMTPEQKKRYIREGK